MKIILLSFLFFFMYPGKRQILLFYNDNGIAVKNKQLSLFTNDEKGLKERDIVIHTYKTNEAAANKWNIKSGAAFTFILVGKDGGEKMRTDTIVSLAQLYKTIDAMPMRKEEMKQQK